MTPIAKRNLTIALTSTFLSAAAIPLLVTLWRLKLDVTVYEVHNEKESTRIVRDSARAEEQHMLLLDVLCATKPTDRRCR
jgi:hypothetical protein